MVALPRLEAAFDLTRIGGDGVHVVGRVSATVSQTCVVTLDPMQNEVDEDDRPGLLPRSLPRAAAPDPTSATPKSRPRRCATA